MPPHKKAAKPAPSTVKIHIDGAARGNPGPAGVGIVISGRKPVEMGLSIGEATNNVAETVALIIALQEALKRGEKRVLVCTDSELLANQVAGLYKVKDKQLQWLHAIIRSLTGGFDSFDIRHVPRAENRQADRLAGKAVIDGLREHSRDRKRKTIQPDSSQAGIQQPTFW
ncbi:MAG: ribonuclease HI family protein [Candidatus Omnitrophica bacterium]|nr:ribonuclease HI family protein [Candidatus Omnitrophota bacterium]